jgi:LPS export ABC transporter protein LptC
MKRIIHINAAFLLAAFMLSCSTKYSSKELVNMGQMHDSLSVEVAEEVQIVYTDSGLLRAKIMAPQMERFTNRKDPYVEMKHGVKARFYDPTGAEQSRLSANYAINYEEKGQIIMRDSVRVINRFDEEIKTDELIWDETDRRIYSDKKVRIRQGTEKILVGEGFESNEGFTKYRVKKLTGVIKLEDFNEETE